MHPNAPDRILRALRGSAYAAFAYAALQIWFLPMPLHRDAAGWTWEPGTLLQVGLTLTVGVLTWRGSRIAAGAAAAYGAWRLGMAALAIVWVLNGTAVRLQNGPALVLSQLVALPFAVFWVRGGLAVLREWRARRPAKGSAPDGA